MYIYLIIVLIIFVSYYLFPKIKTFYLKRHRKNTIEKFKEICNIVELNMNIEDSMKVCQKNIEHRYTIELHRRVPNTDIMDEVPVDKIMEQINKKFKVDSKLNKDIIPLYKQGKVEEFFYGKHPFLPYEKLYIGFLQKQNFGYLLEKKKDKYTKRIYVNTMDFNLNTIFPKILAEKLHMVIPNQILQPKHIYKYDDGNDKPISCYIGINNKYNIKNIMEVLTRILEVFETKKEIIEETNDYMEKYKDKRCYWLGLTNKYGEYFATIYYDTLFTA